MEGLIVFDCYRPDVYFIVFFLFDVLLYNIYDTKIGVMVS
jgi:hypothetical protein